MNGLLIPSLDANAPTARFIHQALAEHAKTTICKLTAADPRADVKSVEAPAAPAAGVIAGYSLGSHVGLRALLRKPHLKCNGLWFCPAPDAASRLGRHSIPPFLRPHMDYLQAHVNAFQPADLIDSLGRLSGHHLFVFGEQDDLRIAGELERIQALELEHVRAIEVPGNHFLEEAVVVPVIQNAMQDWGGQNG